MAKIYVDCDELMNAMYYAAFENNDSYSEVNPMAKWDSGLWIRYKLFENVMDKIHKYSEVDIWMKIIIKTL